MNSMAKSQDEMRKPAPWMNRDTDDPILEVIRDEGNMTPVAVSREGEVPRADLSRSYAGIRMRELEKGGLLKRIDRGLYGITDEGIAYLEEDLDVSELPYPGASKE